MAAYNIIYRNFQNQADSFRMLSRDLASYESRINNASNVLMNYNSNFASLRGQMANSARRLSVLSSNASACSSTIQSAIQNYYGAENRVYGTIAADDLRRLKGIAASVLGAGIGGAVRGPAKPSGWGRLFKDLDMGETWIGGAMSGGLQGIMTLAERVGSMRDFYSAWELGGKIGKYGDAVGFAVAGFNVLGAFNKSRAAGNSTSKIIGDTVAELAYEGTKIAAKKAVCGVAAAKGAAVGAAIGSVFPGPGTVVGAVVGGAVGYIASSVAIDAGMKWLDNTFNVKENISKKVEFVSNGAKAVGGAVKGVGRAVGGLFRRR